MKNVFIHIGMPRTATTFLQQFLFPNLPDISFYGVETAYYSEPFNKLQYADDSIYDPAIFDSLIQSFGDNDILLSNEYLAGQSLYLNHVNRSIIAKRLKHLFPNAKILLVLRNQIEVLQSLYAINVQWQETRSIDDTIWFPFQENKDNNGPSPSYFNTINGTEGLDGYNYLPLVDLYKSLFGDVDVLLFEDFIKEPDKFSEQLAHFFNLDKNVIDELITNNPKINSGVCQKQATKLIRLNKYKALFENTQLGSRVYAKLKRNIIQSKKSDQKVTFSKEKELLLKNIFGKSNQELSTKYPEIGLEKYAKDYYLQ